MAFVTVRTPGLGKALTEAGLIPPQCRRVILDLNVGDIATIYYEAFADEKQVEFIAATIKDWTKL